LGLRFFSNPGTGLACSLALTYGMLNSNARAKDDKTEIRPKTVKKHRANARFVPETTILGYFEWPQVTFFVTLSGLRVDVDLNLFGISGNTRIAAPRCRTNCVFINRKAWN
jgi:hypothetical protein